MQLTRCATNPVPPEVVHHVHFPFREVQGQECRTPGHLDSRESAGNSYEGSRNPGKTGFMPTNVKPGARGAWKPVHCFTRLSETDAGLT